MDPVSRREVWDIIERAKKGRVVILTTHSMEEADTLADTIGTDYHLDRAASLAPSFDLTLSSVSSTRMQRSWPRASSSAWARPFT
jgi:ABC-type nitrate/sulfonate/bicarbonate transport system ATPase subunit